MITRIVTIDRMRALEAYASQTLGLPEITLMESAARAVAEEVQRAAPRHVLCVCGSGNNGADGIACARVLKARGISVSIALLDAHKLSPLGQTQKQIADAFGVPVVALKALNIAKADVVVDALLGIGVHSPLKSKMKKAIHLINQHARSVIAVDLPSGLSEDFLSQDVGDVVQAQKTVTFHALKTVHTQLPGQALSGEVTIADIGIPPAQFDNDDGYLIDDALVTTHWSSNDTLAKHQAPHKGTFGHVALWGGAQGKGGALALSTLAAFHTGVGLVTAAFEGVPRTLPVEVMTATPKDALALKRLTAVGIGPGLGTTNNTAHMLFSFLARSRLPVVLDADALNLLAQEQAWTKRLGPGPRILTPHPLEFTRLFGGNNHALSRIDDCRLAARRSGAIVVLKGAQTVVAAPDGRFAVNSSGGRELAKGGTGDVLTGTITGLLGQRINPFDAACIGVYLHGRAGEVCAAQSSARSVLASDVAKALPKVIARFAGDTP